MMVTVPQTFVGSPRYFRKAYEDTISMMREFGPPDLFITFTGNPYWPEIQVILCSYNIAF